MKNNRKYNILWAIVGGIVISACNGGGQSAGEKPKSKSISPQPDIKALETTFNFGKVKQGTMVEHVFKISNAGKADLAIKQATGS